MKLHKEKGACWHPVLNGGAFTETKEEESFSNGNSIHTPLSVHNYCEPKSFILIRTFVAKVKLKKFNCVDFPWVFHCK